MFDHEFNARMDRDEYTGGYFSSHCRSNSDFNKDPLFYHTKVKFNALVRKTDKAYLLMFEGFNKIWIPVKICRHFDLSTRTVYVHTKTFREIRDNSIGSDFL